MRLSTRQSELVKWICLGKSNSEIGELMGLKTRTVHTMLWIVFNKVGCASRMQLAMKFMQTHGPETHQDESEVWRCLVMG